MASTGIRAEERADLPAPPTRAGSLARGGEGADVLVGLEIVG